MDATGGRLHDPGSARTPRLSPDGTVRAFARAVASRCDCCLLEETTCGLPYKGLPSPRKRMNLLPGGVNLGLSPILTTDHSPV